MSMPQTDIYAGLTEMFRDLFSDDAIVLRPGTTADDIDGWDSITHISIVVATEKLFKVKFSAREIEHFTNVGDLVNAVEAKLAKA